MDPSSSASVVGETNHEISEQVEPMAEPSPDDVESAALAIDEEGVSKRYPSREKRKPAWFTVNAFTRTRSKS